MTEQLEDELRHLFAEDAKRAPAATALAEGARRRARERRRRQLTWGAGVLVAASVVSVVVGAGLLAGGSPAGHETASSPVTTAPAANPPTPGPTGALPGSSNAACVIYSPTNVRRAALAFDGTVTDIGRVHRDSQDISSGLVATTFTVNEWFKGGSGTTVTVDIPTGFSEDPLPPPFGVGTRLLVSGGAPSSNARAWGCGFTRYYDEATATSWRAALG